MRSIRFFWQLVFMNAITLIATVAVLFFTISGALSRSYNIQLQEETWRVLEITAYYAVSAITDGKLGDAQKELLSLQKHGYEDLSITLASGEQYGLNGNGELRTVSGSSTGKPPVFPEKRSLQKSTDSHSRKVLEFTLPFGSGHESAALIRCRRVLPGGFDTWRFMGPPFVVAIICLGAIMLVGTRALSGIVTQYFSEVIESVRSFTRGDIPARLQGSFIREFS
ncbi:MAG: hypothetical protein KDD60_11895, partial [Bdellovibrionales bacterium]|nr:hypothetical protein [Bdellovibrionales bacterium]